jgi:hypothetical protein
MFRSSFFLLAMITILMISSTNGKNITSRKRPLSSTRKPVSVKICGLALVRMLDMICTRARQLLMRKGTETLSTVKRQFIIDEDPYARTVSITDYARKFNFLSKKKNVFFSHFRI